MIVGIVSDTHDYVTRIRDAVEAFAGLSANAIIHAGDIVSPFALNELLKANIPVHIVFGNNDGDRNHLSSIFPAIQTPPMKLELGGRRFLVTHESHKVTDDDLENADVFVFGHTHKYLCEPGPPLTINPGEACGWITGSPTAAVLDTETLKVTKIALD